VLRRQSEREESWVGVMVMEVVEVVDMVVRVLMMVDVTIVSSSS
jgi:hypothetical protein